MEIPDRLSDMDSIPETIGLNRVAGYNAILASLYATTEDFITRGAPALLNSIRQTTQAFNDFGAAMEVVELEELFSK